jgi:hypothetical protein
MLNFEQFAATRTEVSDLGAALGVADMNGIAAYLYEAGCIEKTDDNSFLIHIGNQKWLDKDLSKLERILYDVWYVPQNSNAVSKRTKPP